MLLAPLLYGVSPEAHDRFAGGRERALRLIVTGLERAGTSGSTEVTQVAELAAQAGRRRLLLPGVGGRRSRCRVRRHRPARGPGLAAAPECCASCGGWSAPRPAPAAESLYIDALGTAPEFRRRGVARALLAAAEDRARQLGLGRVSLETEVDNEAARALYESCGFEPGEVGRRLRGLPRYVAYVKHLA